MKITIETVPHAAQRYPTVGDWYFVGDNGKSSDGGFETHEMVIRVSRLGDWRKELLVAVHELVEVAIATNRGVTVEEVDTFDIKFEQSREDGNVDEPGDDPSCPIKREHSIATGVERILAAELGVDWKTYETQIESL